MTIKRDTYLDRLVRAQGDGFVKIVTGIRRAGKSYLLFRLFKGRLLADGVPNGNIVEIQLDKRRDAGTRFAQGRQREEGLFERIVHDDLFQGHRRAQCSCG